MVEAAKAVMHSKYSLLQLHLKELAAQDANITFTSKSELSQRPCKYIWNCPEIVCKVFSVGDSKFFCPKTPKHMISKSLYQLHMASESYLLLPSWLIIN